MTQENKELLLKDLCARLPYGVKYYCNDIKNVWKLNAILTKRQDDSVFLDIYNPLDLCKPYLFPLSSMTEEQKKEQEAHFTCIKHDMSFSICRYMEWCYKNHLDINGLIPKGLAIDATELNIY